LQHDVSLLAYHLPLDAHPELGNNAQLAKRLGLLPQGNFGDQDIAWMGGNCSSRKYFGQFAENIAHALQRTPMVIGDKERLLHRIAVVQRGCTKLFLNRLSPWVWTLF